ncbi:MAG: hypothetical protein QM756_22565 [Polyangiaceae bacterium]
MGPDGIGQSWCLGGGSRALAAALTLAVALGCGTGFVLGFVLQPSRIETNAIGNQLEQRRI